MGWMALLDGDDGCRTSFRYLLPGSPVRVLGFGVFVPSRRHHGSVEEAENGSLSVAGMLNDTTGFFHRSTKFNVIGFWRPILYHRCSQRSYHVSKQKKRSTNGSGWTGCKVHGVQSYSTPRRLRALDSKTSSGAKLVGNMHAFPSYMRVDSGST